LINWRKSYANFFVFNRYDWSCYGSVWRGFTTQANVKEEVSVLKKMEKVQWKSFFDGDVVVEKEVKRWIPIVATGSMIVLKSGIVLAASTTPGGAAGGLAKLLGELLVIADYIAWGGLIFSGLSWMFNNKTVAIERAIGVTAGYLIIRKSWSYVVFLKSI
jgi:hypothetical protein